MIEDDLWWKTTYDGRRLMMEDKLWWKTTYDGRRLMMEDTEDNLWWKKTYEGRRLMMEDASWWKTTYDGRWPIPIPIPILIIGEVSLQKSFPYSGSMCRCVSFFDKKLSGSSFWAGRRPAKKLVSIIKHMWNMIEWIIYLLFDEIRLGYGRGGRKIWST